MLMGTVETLSGHALPASLDIYLGEPLEMAKIIQMTLHYSDSIWNTYTCAAVIIKSKSHLENKLHWGENIRQ